MDAIVIGAGFAGLTAAARLAGAGREVVLLEARDRPGGRAWTAMQEEHPIELGPEWVKGNGHVARLLRAAGGHLAESEGGFYERDSDTWSASRQHDVVERLVRRLLRKGDPDRSVLDALKQAGRDADLRQAEEFLFPYVEGFHAADPARLSSQWLKEVEANASADVSQARALQGLGSAVAHLERSLGERCEVRYNTPARKVTWRAGHVTVTTETETFTARTAVIAVPLGVLQGGDLVFDPPLSSKAAALSQLEMGKVHKAVFAFTRRMWAGRVPPDALFLQDQSLPFPTWWLPVHADLPVIVGWVAGPTADRMTSLDSPQLIGTALDSLARLLRMDRAQLDDAVSHVWYHNWNGDPFARGAYSYVRSGGLEAPSILARPVENTLFFAGEATCLHGLNATVDGAIQSGDRAASEILAGT